MSNPNRTASAFMAGKLPRGATAAQGCPAERHHTAAATDNRLPPHLIGHEAPGRLLGQDGFQLESPTPYRAVLAEEKMPGARWFEGAQFNYARQVFRHVDAAHAAGFPAIVSRNEKGQHRELSWPELRRQVASLALHLQAQGLRPGDRVAAYLPNVPEAMVAFLAVVSLGGVWSICAPDMGTNAVLDRFKQIEPTVLIACDGVTYGGRDFDRTGVVGELRAALPSVHHVIVLRNLGVGDAALRRCSRTPTMRPPLRATMQQPPPSSRSGCRSTTRCGSSIPAAPPACPSRSCTATAAR